MTERPDREAHRTPRRPALASRILAVGASAAATIGLVGAMAARPPAAASQPSPGASPPAARPIHVVVVVRRDPNAATVRQAPSAARKPRVVYRYVRSPARATTTTNGS